MRDKPITEDCDLDLGRGNLNFVLDTPSHYALPLCNLIKFTSAKPHSTVGSMSDSRARDPRFDTRSGHILSFLLPLIQGGQLSVTGESVCMKYWLTTSEL